MLSDAAIRRAKPQAKPFKLYDEDGLFLIVTPQGGRWWRLRWQHEKRQQTISLGTYPQVSLQQARAARDTAKARLRAGESPSPRRRAVVAPAAGETIKEVAAEWLEKRRSSFAAGHLDRVRRRIAADVLPRLGDKRARDITAPMVLEVLRLVEERGAIETAHRVKTTISQILCYAVATARAERDVTVDLQGALEAAVSTHHAAITEPRAVGALMRAIDGYMGSHVVRVALRLAPLVFVRPGELQRAEWRELNLDAAEWRIDAAKMKIRIPHIVPLATQSVALLREIEPETSSGRWVFPNHNDKAQPMSNNTLCAALRGLGYSRDQHVAHGFRTTASTLLNESGLWSRDAIERQLAHVSRDKVRAAYDHSEHLPERRRMMQWWADRLDELRRL